MYMHAYISNKNPNCILAMSPQDEKEQLLQYCSTVAGLVGRAKNIVQLRPRNPESNLRSSIPVKAICDYRQIEVHAPKLRY